MWKAQPFQIPDVTKILAVPDLLKLTATCRGVAIAQQVKCDLLNLYASLRRNTPVVTPGTHYRHAFIVRLRRRYSWQSSPTVNGTRSSSWLCGDRIPHGARSRVSGIQTGRPMHGLRAIVAGRSGNVKRLFVFPFAVCAETGNGSAPVTTHNLAFARTQSACAPATPQPLPGTGSMAE